MNLPRRGGRALRVCIAPGDFEGDTNAAKAAIAMERGAQRAAQSLDIKIRTDLCPIVDSGREGLLDAMALAMALTLKVAQVEGPFGDPITARWGMVRPRRSKIITATTLFIHTVLLIWMTIMYTAYMLLYGRRGASAVIDTNAVIGPDLIPPEHRDPTRVSTFGVGQLIHQAFKAHGKRVHVTLGDTMSCDGGIGMAVALGVRFYDHDDALIERPTGADLRSIARLDISEIDPAISGAKMVVSCPECTPLTGATGAPRVQGPRQGATPEQIEDLDLGLEWLVRLCRESGLHAEPDAFGAGAGGGLGFSLATFFGATLSPAGAGQFEMTRIVRRMKKADLVLTGGRPPTPPTEKESSPVPRTPILVAVIAEDLNIPRLNLRMPSAATLEDATAEAVREWLTP